MVSRLAFSVKIFAPFYPVSNIIPELLFGGQVIIKREEVVKIE